MRHALLVVPAAATILAGCDIDFGSPTLPYCGYFEKARSVVVEVASFRSDTLTLTQGSKGRIVLQTKRRDACPNDWGERVVWSNSDTTVATVGEYGRVLAWSVGHTEISASAGGKTVTMMIRVLPIPPVERFTAINANLGLTCALAAQGSVYCWGDLGLQFSSDTTRVPLLISTTPAIASLSLGGAAWCGVTVVGMPHCWLGRDGPHELAEGIVFRSISTRGGPVFHTCGVSTDGIAYCWGPNQYGQLGVGDEGSRQEPAVVVGDHLFESVHVGYEHTCGLTVEGSVFCWGHNDTAQLGSPAQPDCAATGLGCSVTPIRIWGDIVFRGISVGSDHNCGISIDGAAYCWGTNLYGQLGTDDLGVQVPRGNSFPVPVSGGLTFVSVSAGSRHTCGIADDGRAYCWGVQWGTPSDVPYFDLPSTTVPTLMSADIEFKQLSAGRSHTCGVTAAGLAYCWGENDVSSLSLLGTVSPYDSSVPVRVAGQQ